MWRRTERASLEKKPSTRLSQEPCLGVKVNSNLPAGCAASQAHDGSSRYADRIRARSTRLAGSVRDCAIDLNLSTSASPSDNSIARP
jgi:hypothetical protein